MAEIITDGAMQDMMDEYGSCMMSMSPTFVMPSIFEPGLGSVMTAIIRIIEKGLTTSFEPILILVELVKDVAEIPNKLPDFINEWTPVFNDPLGFIIEKLLDPLMKHIVLPLPKIETLIQILLGTIKLEDLNWKDKNLFIEPPLFKKLPNIKKTKIWELIQSAPQFIIKFLEFVFSPIKIMMGFFEAFMKKIKDALTVPKIPGFISEWLNPIQGLLDMLGEIFGDIISTVIKKLTGITADIKDFIIDLFTGKINIASLRDIGTKFPELKPVLGLLSMFFCFIEWTLGFITDFPSLIF